MGTDSQKFEGQSNFTADLNLQKLQVITDCMSLVTNCSWQELCKHVENVEKEYWRRDAVVPDGIDNIIKHCNADDYSEADTAM